MQKCLSKARKPSLNSLNSLNSFSSIQRRASLSLNSLNSFSPHPKPRKHSLNSLNSFSSIRRCAPTLYLGVQGLPNLPLSNGVHSNRCFDQCDCTYTADLYLFICVMLVLADKFYIPLVLRLLHILNRNILLAIDIYRE